MAKRLLELEPTSLFGEKAILTSLSGREEVSRPFEFVLNISSPNDKIKPEDVIGKPLAVRIDRAEEAHAISMVTSAICGQATLVCPRAKSRCPHELTASALCLGSGF